MTRLRPSIAGLLLFLPRTRFLGSLLLVPITANIVMYHFTFDFPGNPPIGLFTALLHVILLYTQRNQLTSLVAAPATA